MTAAGEGTKYPIFTSDASRVKSLSNGSGNKSEWWTRSPYVSNTSSYVCVGTTGGVGTASATYYRGICFGFCI